MSFNNFAGGAALSLVRRHRVVIMAVMPLSRNLAVSGLRPHFADGNEQRIFTFPFPFGVPD